MVKKQRFLSLVLVFILAMTSLLFAEPNENAADAFDSKITARLDTDRAIEHIRYLSEEVGTRPGGLETEWQGAQYIASVFEEYGYEVEMQPFPVSDQYIARIILKDGTEWELGSLQNALITGDEFVEGEVVFVEGGTLPEQFDSDVQDKFVLMQNINRNIQVANAVNAGAKGVILYNVVGSRGNYGSAFSSRLSQSYDVPALGAAYIQGVWLKEMLEQGPVTIKVQTKYYSNLQSLNVIATKPAKSKNPNAPVVVIGGHMDTVVGAPGANDDASGVALTLELARILRGYNTDTEIRFMAYGSEERGLLGSRYYVDNLSPEDKARIIGMFSADMIATPYEPAENLYAMSVNGMPNAVTDASVTAGARLGNSDILPGKFGSSDHVPFHNAGIPAALFIWMGVDSWDPLVYYIEKVYHTPQDTMGENVSMERMQSALDVICSAVFDLVRKEVPALENSAIRE